MRREKSYKLKAYKIAPTTKDNGEKRGAKYLPFLSTKQEIKLPQTVHKQTS